jgi:hypothetical protein
MSTRPIFIDRSGLTVGADPEFFVKRGDDFLSGHGFPCGTKDNPRRTQHGKVQCDGVALEVNVTEAFTEEKFVLNFRGVFHDLNEIVRKWETEAYLVAEPVASFPAAYLDKLPVWAKTLGCNPDFNAYTMNANDTPNADMPIRTGAGHLHIGWTENAEGLTHFEKCAILVKQLDYTVGLQTLLFDDEQRRRMLYGKAGAFRPKPYGVEYRVPSNAWCQSEALARQMFQGCVRAVDLLNDGVELDNEAKGLARELIDSNAHDWTERFPKLADLVIFS